MAKVKKNPILEGISGRIGNLVFKQYRDKTVVSSRPVHDPKRKPTPGEARQRKRIQEAALLAKSILATEDGQAYYQAARVRLAKHSSYHTAIFDFFEAPEVVAVMLNSEGEVLIHVRDNVGVRAVIVDVFGERIKAEALEAEPCGLWRCQFEGTAPTQVQISAEDGMGNIGKWQGLITLKD